MTDVDSNCVVMDPSRGRNENLWCNTHRRPYSRCSDVAEGHLRTVSVDFDGVLHSYASGWTGYEPTDGPEPGALEFIESLIAQGFTPVVVSSRGHTELGRMHIHGWLQQHGFPTMRVTNEKVLAVAYVDDRAVPYQTGSCEWPAVMDSIHRLAARASEQDVAQSATVAEG